MPAPAQVFTHADEKSLQLAESRERLALSTPACTGTGVPVQASTLRDLLPQLKQAPTAFWWQFIEQLLDFIQHPQQFFWHRFPQLAEGAPHPTPHMELTDLVLQPQLFSYLAEPRQVTAQRL